MITSRKGIKMKKFKVNKKIKTSNGNTVWYKGYNEDIDVCVVPTKEYFSKEKTDKHLKK